VWEGVMALRGMNRDRHREGEGEGMNRESLRRIWSMSMIIIIMINRGGI